MNTKDFMEGLNRYSGEDGVLYAINENPELVSPYYDSERAGFPLFKCKNPEDYGFKPARTAKYAGYDYSVRRFEREDGKFYVDFAWDSKSMTTWIRVETK